MPAQLETELPAGLSPIASAVEAQRREQTEALKTIRRILSCPEGRGNLRGQLRCLCKARGLPDETQAKE